jgi:hypothetical protein
MAKPQHKLCRSGPVAVKVGYISIVRDFFLIADDDRDNFIRL